MVTQNGQSIETGNTGHTRQRKKTKTKTKQNPTQCALDTAIRKQTHITLIRHEPSCQKLEEKNELTIVCMRKSQHGTPNVKSHNRRTQNTKKMSNTDLNDR